MHGSTGDLILQHLPASLAFCTSVHPYLRYESFLTTKFDIDIKFQGTWKGAQARLLPITVESEHLLFAFPHVLHKCAVLENQSCCSPKCCGCICELLCHAEACVIGYNTSKFTLVFLAVSSLCKYVTHTQ
jgi:hypothetical protein